MKVFFLLITLTSILTGCFHHKHKKSRPVISQEIVNPSPIKPEEPKLNVPLPDDEGKKNPDGNWWSWE